MRIISIFLLIPSVFLVIYLIVKDLKKILKYEGWGGLFQKEMILQIIAIPLLLLITGFIASHDFSAPGVGKGTLLWVFSILLAFLISMFWLLYLTWLDIYEREQPLYLAITFILGCAAVVLVYPLTDLVNAFDFYLNNTFLNDFAYSVIGIGLVEELVKFLPWFLMLRFSKQINEPFDYLLYASVSALGFAFVENVLYLERSGLQAVYSRALFTSVAHMFFSSVIAYGVIWFRQRKVGFGLFQFLILWFLAALAHGFYDFWLISMAYRAEILTFVFFLLTIHAWVLMKNNLINISGFYDPEIKLQSDIFMYRLINLMLTVLAVALLGYNFLNGSAATRHFFFTLVTNYTYVFAYITISFSSYLVIPGYFARFSLPGNWLLPKVVKGPDLVSKRLELGRFLKSSEKNNHEIRDNLPGSVLAVEKRVVFDGDPHWYLSRFGQQVILIKVIENIRKSENSLYMLNILQLMDDSDGNGVLFAKKHVIKLGVLLAKEA